VPPRPLVSGAFLRGEFEIKALLARGLTNLYQASGGDYGDTVPKLVAERDLPPAPAASDASGPAAPAPAPSGEESLGAQERADELRFEEECGGPPEVPALLPPGEIFTQDEREYGVFDYFESTALQDYREPMNDERLLAVLHSLVHGIAFLEARGLAPELTTETLRIDSSGALRYVGFASPAAEGESALPQLRQITDFLLKHVFAESSTMRLDDRFAGLALSEEVKELARRIDAESPLPFTGIGEVAAAIDAIYSPGRRLAVDAALLTDVGQERALNEDAGMIVRAERAAHLGSRALELYVVSDGMGGHEGGEVASDMTLSALQRHLDALQIDWNDNVAVRAGLVDVIDAVNADVVALTETPKYRGTRAKPGATLVFAVRLGIRLFIGNVGDSRAYRFNREGLRRVTKDHSYVQGLIDRGEITEDEAWDHPEGSIITAHIGYPKLKTRDVFMRLAIPGDRLLLVSDGVVDMLRDRDIENYLQAALAHNDDSATICRDIVDASNAAGGFDNITVVCVGFQ
jgi:protein phosphatase